MIKLIIFDLLIKPFEGPIEFDWPSCADTQNGERAQVFENLVVGHHIDRIFRRAEG